MEENKTYGEALKELERLVAAIEDPERSLEGLAADVRTATELVKYCQAHLKSPEDELTNIINS